MKTIWTLFKKDWLVFSKDKTAVILTFLVPLVLITIFGMVFGGSSSGPSGIRLIVIDEANSQSSVTILEALEEEETFRVAKRIRAADGETMRVMTREDALRLLETKASSYRYALILPEDLVSAEFGLNLEFFYNPQNGIENQMVQGLLQKVLFTNGFSVLLNAEESGYTDEIREAFESDLVDIIAENFGADPEEIRGEISSGFWGGTESESTSSTESEEDPASSDGGFDMGGFVSMEKTQVFGQGINPAAQSVGGWSVMFLLFSLSGAASSLFEEKTGGIFQRILAGYARRDHILWSKFLFCGSLGFIQMVFLLAFGHIVFDVIESPSQILPLVFVCLFSSAAATSFGMLLSSVAKSPAQANGLGTLLILSMSSLGGAMFPSFMLPSFIQDWISPVTLVHWSMDAILGVLWRQESLLGISLQLGVLAGIAAVILAIALFFFRRGDLFR